MPKATSSGNAEIVMGEALKALNWSRDSYAVSSKVFWGGDKPTQRGLSAKHVTDAAHAALKRLQVDYLDLYFCHRPDIDTPIEETVRAMHNLIVQGKVLYWGTSEWTAQQLTEAYAVARQRAPDAADHGAAASTTCSGARRWKPSILPLYDLFGLGTTIWSPLASGILTGKYNDGIPADSRMNLPGYEWLKARLDSDKGKDELEQGQAARQARRRGRACRSTTWRCSGATPTRNVSTVILGASQAEPAQGQPQGARRPRAS